MTPIWTEDMEQAIGLKRKCYGHYDADALVCIGCEYDDTCWKLKKACGEIPENELVKYEQEVQ